VMEDSSVRAGKLTTFVADASSARAPPATVPQKQTTLQQMTAFQKKLVFNLFAILLEL